MQSRNGESRKRYASKSPDTHTTGDDKSNNKKRFVLVEDALTQSVPEKTTETKVDDDLDIQEDVAQAVGSTTANSPPTLHRRKRIVLQSSQSPPPGGPKKFNLVNSLVSHVDILLQVVGHLPPDTVLNLYSISAPFHYIMDSHFTSFIMAATRTWAPDADRFFPWWCYRNLCIQDPALRRARTDRRSVSWDEFQPRSSNPSSFSSSFSSESSTDTATSTETDEEVQDRIDKESTERQSDPAPVPGFRWLKMAAYREIVCKEIIGWLAVHGHRIPRQTGLEALKRMWFLLDIPVNAPRISLMHNTSYFTKETLSVLQLLFIKLDMLYTDPLHGYGGEESVREMLMAERTLTTLWNYLRGADGRTKVDVLKLWVKHHYKRPSPTRPMTQATHEQHLQKMEMPIMGIPASMVGRWGYECWGLGAKKLLRPDELVLMEAMRRNFPLQRLFMQYMAYGYIDEDLNPLPSVVGPEDVVLSHIVRKKRREEEQRKNKEREMGMEGDDLDVNKMNAGARKEDEDLGATQDLDMLGRQMSSLLNTT